MKGRGNLEEFHLPGRVLVIRRFRRGGLVRLANKDRFLDPERPFEEIRLSLALQQLGFQTPTIVAARSQRVGILGYRLEVVTERVDGAQSLGRLLGLQRAGLELPVPFAELAACFGDLVRRMHAVGFVHSDLQPENFLWRPGTEGALWILDLDRSRFEGTLPLAAKLRVQNLWRLWRYILRGDAEARSLRRVDYQRFLKHYEPDRLARRELVAQLAQIRQRRARWHRSEAPKP
ncbi:MAG: hypothetical protein H6830_01055 [Planctomycetes bacterium]|nr:hypothetical protein [Planctomycetota bacterium]MCB9911111.1 hypothetical protein [Planctomycetota bacterium]MCB9912156.1 hypothetical protein [Planctomycetota bacterium]HPF15001.1 lipopolysaccharide kinase InaA family protein [Planctomycetota bacterium]